MSTVGSALATYLGNAAATMTPAVTQVQQGEPDVVNLPMWAYWFMGVKTWDANTFSYTQELSCWHIRVYIPIGPRAAPLNIPPEDWLADSVDAIRGALWGAVLLGGAATGEGFYGMLDAPAGYAQVGNQMCRVADMDIEVMLSNVHQIKPS